MSAYSVSFRDFSFKPPGREKKGVLRDLNFEIHPNEFVSIIGRNGQGKTSIIKSISGEHNQKYCTGGVWVGFNQILGPVREYAHGVGIVHQYVQDDLIKYLSISKNIQIRQLLSYNKKVRDNAYIKDWEGRINQRLKNHLGSNYSFDTDVNTLVDNLSGGQRQLLNVLIAAEFEHKIPGESTGECNLLLLDEHLTSLDVVVKDQVMELILELRSQNNMTIIMVTHDLNYALQYSDRILVISDGQISDSFYKSDEHKWHEGHLKYLMNV